MSGRLKRAVYARLEETSFRSGAGAVATMLVVLVVAGVAIALAVLLNGHSAAVAAPQGTVPGTPASRSAPAVPSSSAVIPADTATPAPAPGTPSQPVTAPTRPAAHPSGARTPRSTAPPVPPTATPTGGIGNYPSWNHWLPWGHHPRH